MFRRNTGCDFSHLTTKMLNYSFKMKVAAVLKKPLNLFPLHPFC